MCLVVVTTTSETKTPPTHAAPTQRPRSAKWLCYWQYRHPIPSLTLSGMRDGRMTMPWEQMMTFVNCVLVHFVVLWGGHGLMGI